MIQHVLCLSLLVGVCFDEYLVFYLVWRVIVFHIYHVLHTPSLFRDYPYVNKLSDGKRRILL
jgi:hypothetical protein